MMKKGRSGKNSSGDRSALAGAMRDLENEFTRLKREKNEINKILEGISTTLNFDRGKERELQERIAKLIEKEAKLNEKRKGLQGKIDGVSDKIGKISKIKTEMADI